MRLWPIFWWLAAAGLTAVACLGPRRAAATPTPAPAPSRTAHAPGAPPAAEARAARRAPTPPPLPREFRGAWVATVANIDWPSRPGLPTAAARAELDQIVARASELHLNALVFQVRPAGDALYESALEPWSEFLTGAQGRAPEPRWDPLQHLIERCHGSGIELHAWFNPFRASHPKGSSPPAPNHVRRAQPAACVRYGSHHWMDPGDPRSAAWTLRVIRDVVQRYDVDGVHLDDYFYPYPEGKAPFPDAKSRAAYTKAGGKLALADWRRDNVDRFVRELERTVHQTKPWVLVGISPFGIAQPGVPAGIQAGLDQFGQLYADPAQWLRTGRVDYLAPQLYWPIDQKPQSFAVLLPWWLGQNERSRHVWPGLDLNRIRDGKPPVRPDELDAQLALLRSRRPVELGSRGQLLFSFQTLRSDLPAVGGALRRLFAEPALVPATPWLPANDPAPPTLELQGPATARRVAWRLGQDVRAVAVQVETRAGWRTQVLGAAVGSLALPADARAVAATAIGRLGRASAPAVQSL
ncbi:MAG: family 10 glycosylhydrolase [Planctomycetes bacterium]|nr:family 10 glycosylhydrolase [Planctomycetota bacterium]